MPTAASMDADRLGVTVDLPDDPAVALPVGPTGDLRWLSGRDALAADLRKRMVTSPGALVYRPTFGAGAMALLGQPNSPAARAKFASTARRNLLDDARIVDATVSVSAGSTSSAVTTALTVTLRDDSKTALSVAVGA